MIGSKVARNHGFPSNHACSSRHPRAKAATLGTADLADSSMFSDVLLVAEW